MVRIPKEKINPSTIGFLVNWYRGARISNCYQLAPQATFAWGILPAVGKSALTRATNECLRLSPRVTERGFEIDAKITFYGSEFQSEITRFLLQLQHVRVRHSINRTKIENIFGSNSFKFQYARNKSTYSVLSNSSLQSGAIWYIFEPLKLFYLLIYGFSRCGKTKNKQF